MEASAADPRPVQRIRWLAARDDSWRGKLQGRLPNASGRFATNVIGSVGANNGPDPHASQESFASVTHQARGGRNVDFPRD